MTPSPAAVRAYDLMRNEVSAAVTHPFPFDLSELAHRVLASLDQDALAQIVVDALIHKGRQHCGGKVRRPDGEEGVISDVDRGRFPRAVPVDRRGTSTWIGWQWSDVTQRFDAASRRSSQALGLQTEADRIAAEAFGSGYTPRAAPPVGADSVPVSVDRNTASPDLRIPEREWEGGSWLGAPAK
jgi:hypothetical protein